MRVSRQCMVTFSKCRNLREKIINKFLQAIKNITVNENGCSLQKSGPLRNHNSMTPLLCYLVSGILDFRNNHPSDNTRPLLICNDYFSYEIIPNLIKLFSRNQRFICSQFISKMEWAIVSPHDSPMLYGIESVIAFSRFLAITFFIAISNHVIRFSQHLLIVSTHMLNI